MSRATRTSAAGRENDPQQLLFDALERLRSDPSLRDLAPDGKVTFSDPILAVACAWADTAVNATVPAAAEGSELRATTIYRWALAGVQAWLNRNDREQVALAARVPGNSISLPDPTARIAVVGDAGFRGLPQEQVLALIEKAHNRERFDLILHLGDTYFAGGEGEFLRHLLAPFSALGVRFASLCGNHDLYHGAAGYLAALDVLGQPGRYFLIENRHWRIACLDTALAATHWLRNEGALDTTQLRWLRTQLLADDPRPLVLMSHHFIVSAWEKVSRQLARQLGYDLRSRIFAWYWGHEHRSACYGKGAWGFYGACIGNGAFLEPWSRPAPRKARPEWHAMTRCTCALPAAESYWPHGFLELELRPDCLVESYQLESGETHLRSLAVS